MLTRSLDQRQHQTPEPQQRWSPSRSDAQMDTHTPETEAQMSFLGSLRPMGLPYIHRHCHELTCDLRM